MDLTTRANKLYDLIEFAATEVAGKALGSTVLPTTIETFERLVRDINRFLKAIQVVPDYEEDDVPCPRAEDLDAQLYDGGHDIILELHRLLTTSPVWTREMDDMANTMLDYFTF